MHYAAAERSSRWENRSLGKTENCCKRKNVYAHTRVCTLRPKKPSILIQFNVFHKTSEERTSFFVVSIFHCTGR